MAISKISNGGVATSGLPTGTVLQTVTNATAGAVSNGTNTSLGDISNFTVSITPTSASSKIFVSVSCLVTNTLVSGANVAVAFALLRDSTSLASTIASAQSGSGGLQIRDSVAFSNLDSPNTTSAVTYKVQGNTNNASSGYYVSSGRIVVMEIAGQDMANYKDIELFQAEDGSVRVEIASQALLDATDWTQIPNSGLTSSCVTAFDTYRQALRVIRKTNPSSPTWPDAPTEEWT